MQDIPGEIPGLIDPPSGCRFHPRCDFATSECAATRPPVTGTTHTVRCYHPLRKRSMSAPLLEATGLAQRFAVKDGRVLRAVDGVDLAVAEGEILGIVGEIGLRQVDPRQDADRRFAAR